MEKSNEVLDSSYMAIQQIPSRFRSYEGVNTLYVRGMVLEEVTSASKYIAGGSPSYTQLYATFKNVIKGVDILNLEVVDFRVLLIISSIWSTDGYGWPYRINCSNKECGKEIKGKIVLDDFEFTEPKTMDYERKVMINGEDCYIGPITVGDMIAKESYISNFEGEMPEYLSIAVDYALSIKDSKFSNLEEKIEFVKSAPYSSLMGISEFDKDLSIKILPVEVPCSCGEVNKMFVTLNSLRVIPEFSYENLVELNTYWLEAFKTSLNGTEQYNLIKDTLAVKKKKESDKK